MVSTGTTPERYAGLDIGTTSVSCAVVDTAAGQVLRAWSRPHGAELPQALPDEHLQDAHRLLVAARSSLDEALDRYGPFRGIGVTGQMHGILYVDTDGRAISPLYTWLDARASRTSSDGRPYHQVLEQLTGRKVAVGMGAATHFVNLHIGAVPPGARGVCGISEYAAMQLAGTRAPVTDPTLAHGLGLYDPNRGDFDPQAWAKLGEPFLALPEVVAQGRVLGRYEGRIPVCTPLGDNQASFLGSIREPARSALVNIGTSAQISFLNSLMGEEECRFDTTIGLERRPYPDGRVLYVGASLTGGKALERLASLIGEIIRVAGGTVDDPYQIMAAVPSAVPEPLLRVDTRLAGSRVDPDVRGSIGNITLQNFTLGHLVHGFCQGIVNELHQFWVGSGVDVTYGQALEYLVGSGHAIRANRILREHMAAAFGKPLLVPIYREEAAVGAALHAAAIVEARQHHDLARMVVTYGEPGGADR
ncbi:sedoheptulokinase [Limnochorda pilosa]|uniref:Carbohydrate kinase FGGY N-terminal domain-containing protein n=1 Tax=Limnochorda pilosa TaxID=1555112 RepID=A0A0K2SLQ2_LIMPI|nr:FGGY family carbohydrate kinase [Limnochorda pilosa]BAS28048.1 hypothetical protein LIP_2207 [Limnochorda pilosa]